MELRFDFAQDDTTTGFRLEEFSLYNWGTYDKQVVTLALDKHNGLLTGDIGSGKSTIVDAITTLLVSPQKITFNKAAGADAKERTLKSYILGEYKSAQDEALGNAKAVALRDENSFTVLLARFENEGFDESYTVAQFLYISNSKVQKFFISSRNLLTIKKDFLDSDFKDIRALKKSLRALPHTEVYDSFVAYEKDFKRAVGITNEQALNLFYQTVSLKSIGNLTSFVREQMLERGTVDEQIDTLCKNFAELSHAHTLVLRAKEQIEMLTPIDKEAKVYENLLKEKEKFEAMRDGLKLYFASFKQELLGVKIEELQLNLTKTESKKKHVDKELKELDSKRIDLTVELQKNGGERLGQLQGEHTRHQKELEAKKETHSNYNTLAKSLGLATVSNEHRFLKNSHKAQKQLLEIGEQRSIIENEQRFSTVSIQKYKGELAELESEIIYLQNNRSNIPKYISDIRDTMAEHLSLDVIALPFVGEILKVKDVEWQGAIERVLHSFSLSLLVDENYYEAVSSYVNETYLRGKLVYLKIAQKKRQRELFEQSQNSLLQKIEIKADSPFYEMVNGMLYERFDIACVDTLEAFRKHKKALTKKGQFKSSYTRHEKDDRYDITDKSRWTLGWDNAQKLAALQKKQLHLTEKLSFVEAALVDGNTKLKKLESQRDSLRDILKYKSFDALDFYTVVKKIEAIESELALLEKSSDIIAVLQQELQKVQAQIVELKPQEEEYSQKIGALRNKIETRTKELQELEKVASLKEGLQKSLDEFSALQSREKLTLTNVNAREQELHQELQKEIDKCAKKIQNLVQKILTMMNSYTSKFKVESQEFDASMDSLEDFRAKLAALKRDDLPKFEKRFRLLFREKTLQETVMIQEELEHNEKEIKKKIEKINTSLQEIEYNSGTYIKLIAEPSNIKEIREFKQELKSAISYAISADNSYDEAKFLQIKNIIDRFNGREGQSEVDKRWKALVTDVRNWFNFSASERYISDDSEKEYYAHSGGKSGGQKEKLAYTVLASSLAFQFGLEYNEIKSRSFRFVMIDEAFGKGSDESTRYALRLFEKLHLQLLVITPKTKINVIEPFVKSIHFVHNQDGMHSSLLSMSIEEYQKNARSQ